jgi:16S rRNA G1207 methylase RsmC
LRPEQELSFDAELRGFDFRFHSTWGLFSPKSVDEGSQLLIDCLDASGSETVLDVGCGYGPIGLAAAKLNPDGRVHLVDKDFVAVEYARKNAVENNIGNAEAYLSNGLGAVPDNLEFDKVLSNLPAKVGNELLSIIIHDAKERLKPGGSLIVVTIAGLREHMKRSFREVFGNYKKLKTGKTWTVSMAVKED